MVKLESTITKFADDNKLGGEMQVRRERYDTVWERTKKSTMSFTWEYITKFSSTG